MTKLKLTMLAAAALPGLALAQEAANYECSHGDLKRRVEIVYETGVTVPCEVHYYKDTEVPGDRQVLWRALNEEGYCEEKTREFVAKLDSWGWSCTEVSPPPEEAPASEETDDSETLAPAEVVEGNES